MSDFLPITITRLRKYPQYLLRHTLKKKVGSDHVISIVVQQSASRTQELQPSNILERRLIKKNSPVVVVLVQWEAKILEDATSEEYKIFQMLYRWFSGQDPVWLRER